MLTFRSSSPVKPRITRWSLGCPWERRSARPGRERLTAARFSLGANIFLTSSGLIKLGDFGCSVKLKNNAQTMPGEVNSTLGTAGGRGAPLCPSRRRRPAGRPVGPGGRASPQSTGTEGGREGGGGLVFPEGNAVARLGHSDSPSENDAAFPLLSVGGLCTPFAG